MSLETVKIHLKRFAKDKEIIELDESTATVLEAAKALKTDPDSIAKTIALSDNIGGCIILVTSGTSRLDNVKFKSTFGYKPRMLSPEDTLKFTSHEVGGVCPFGLNDTSGVFLDISLKKHDKVYPACGSRNSAIELSLDELVNISGSDNWVDVCKNI